MLPEVLVIGCNRSGTTALHRALVAHPLITPPNLHKGVGYFDLNYQRGERWYRGHFPIQAVATWRSGQRVRLPMAMETSNYYFDYPWAADRIAKDLPHVRMIAILRNPVERAHSAYRHNVNRGMETESFESTIELEATRNLGEQDRIRADPQYESFADRSQSHLRRGQYADRLEVYFELFDRTQIHVMFTEDFEQRPEEEYDAILRFLDLPAHHPAAGFPRWNAAPPAEMLPETRRFLEDHYAPYDDRLQQLLGRSLPWRAHR